MAKDNTFLYIGGAAVLGYLFLSGSSTAAPIVSTAAANLPAGTAVNSSGIPVSPTGVWNQQWYLTYQYPAMAALDPNILNPNYVMSDAEAQQYINNYYDLSPQFLNAAPAYWGTTPLNRARYHWRSFGAPEKRTFLPLVPK